MWHTWTCRVAGHTIANRERPTVKRRMRRETRPSGNIVGPQVRRLRYASGLSQPALAAACQRLGWDVGRDIIARIETQVRFVTDAELLYLASALQTSLHSLYPRDAVRDLKP